MRAYEQIKKYLFKIMTKIHFKILLRHSQMQADISRVSAEGGENIDSSLI